MGIELKKTDRNVKVYQTVVKADGFVSYEEAQALTDNEKTLARQNISAIGYNWHGFGYYLTTAESSWVANVYDDSTNATYQLYNMVDWDKALTLESATKKNYSLLYVITQKMNYILNYNNVTEETFKNEIVNYLIPEVRKLESEGCLADANGIVRFEFFYTTTVNDVSKYQRFALQLTDNYMFLWNRGNGQRIYYYSNTDTINHTIAADCDTTLTISNKPADAKTVGDRLAEIEARLTALETTE